jgi:hypothetical protein
MSRLEFPTIFIFLLRANINEHSYASRKMLVSGGAWKAHPSPKMPAPANAPRSPAHGCTLRHARYGRAKTGLSDTVTDKYIHKILYPLKRISNNYGT